jgi:hypothetical protein
MSTPPNHNGTKAPKGNSPQAKEEDSPTPSEVLAALLDSWDATREYIRHYWAAPRQKPKWTETATLILTVLIAAASIISAWIFYRQMDEMHKARIAEERAWLAPEQMTLGSAVESGLPLKYQIRLVNPGREPALSATWNVKPYGVPYIPEMETANQTSLGTNDSCSNLEPETTQGIVIYPSGPTNFWLPLNVKDTPENRQLLNEVVERTKSLIIEGCFAYIAGSDRHTSAFRFFLRDVSGPSVIKDKNGISTAAWNFNATLTGNNAD